MTDPKSAAEPTPSTPPSPATEHLAIDDFLRIDLRVALVLSAERVEGTDKLLKLQVELGGEQRQIVSGIAKAYTPEQLVGKRIVVVCNLKPAKLRGVLSQGCCSLRTSTVGRSSRHSTKT